MWLIRPPCSLSPLAVQGAQRGEQIFGRSTYDCRQEVRDEGPVRPPSNICWEIEIKMLYLRRAWRRGAYQTARS